LKNSSSPTRPSTDSLPKRPVLPRTAVQSTGLIWWGKIGPEPLF
jgi:hypothetical protein